MDGIFCANYCSSRGNFPPCQQAWHPECFTLKAREFPTRDTYDQEGNIWFNNGKRIREMTAAVGAAGVHAIQPFQCPTCWVRNLEHRDPGAGDAAYVRTIRRAILDGINGVSRATIAQHRGRVKEVVRNAERINKTPSLHPRGPMPLGDPLGMGVAVDILQKSVHARGAHEKYVQVETLRQVRSTHTKNYESSPVGVKEGGAFSRGAGVVRPTSCPTQSDWYRQFWSGVEKRMGWLSKANHALKVGAMLDVINRMWRDAEASEDEEEKGHLWKVGAYLTLCTVGGLRGHEGFFLDLAGLRRHLDTGRRGQVPPDYTHETVLGEGACESLPHVVVPLLGKFKGGNTVDHHIINLASETKSGFELRKWMDKLVEITEEEGRTDGPAFADSDGNLACSLDYNETFLEYLKQTQIARTDLIGPGVKVKDMYGIYRTPRKTQTTRIMRCGLGNDIGEMNRWRSVEGAKGKPLRLRMCTLYSEAVYMMPVTWRLSHAL